METNSASASPMDKDTDTGNKSGKKIPKLPDESSSKKDDAKVESSNDTVESPEKDSSDDERDVIGELLSAQLESLKLPDKILTQTSVDGVIQFIKDHPNLNIITMVGAGISTAAGIPDFRTPGTGIYDNVNKYNLPYPSAIFELNYFISNPEPFFHLAREMFPASDYAPTKAHHFIRLLQEKGLLLRHYTQNIDNLDRTVGITEEKLIEAHGTFHTSHCLECKAVYSLDWLRENIKDKAVPECPVCEGVVKPDIVFFGETLPHKFYQHISDFGKCDLLIIMGSSLAVEPFASLVTRVRPDCPRLMINATPAGLNLGLMFKVESNGRDVLWVGTCDEGCQMLAEKLGWEKDLNDLVSRSKKD